MALLLENETVDGAEVYRIVGRPVPERRPEELTIVPHAATAATPAPGGSRRHGGRAGGRCEARFTSED